MEATIERARTYVWVYVALMALLVLTTASAYVDLGFMNSVLNVTIAIAKTVLIILFFMHLRHSSRLTAVFAVAGFFWLAILISFTVSDYLSRGLLPVPGK